MGLDISALGKIVPIDIPDGIVPWSDQYYEWEESMDIGHLWYYGLTNVFHEQAEGLKEGAYVAEGEIFGFRAGSYTGYGMWRDELAHAA